MSKSAGGRGRQAGEACQAGFQGKADVGLVAVGWTVLHSAFGLGCSSKTVEGCAAACKAAPTCPLALPSARSLHATTSYSLTTRCLPTCASAAPPALSSLDLLVADVAGAGEGGGLQARIRGEVRQGTGVSREGAVACTGVKALLPRWCASQSHSQQLKLMAYIMHSITPQPEHAQHDHSRAALTVGLCRW